MKNITVSVSDELYLVARIRAAQRSTTVSALVKDFLENLPENSRLDLEFPENLPDPLPPPIYCETVRL